MKSGIMVSPRFHRQRILTRFDLRLQIMHRFRRVTAQLSPDIAHSPTHGFRPATAQGSPDYYRPTHGPPSRTGLRFAADPPIAFGPRRFAIASSPIGQWVAHTAKGVLRRMNLGSRRGGTRSRTIQERSYAFDSDAGPAHGLQQPISA
jgi:hypothetical protein